MGNFRVPFIENSTYHVFNHGNGDDNIFRSDENRRYFMEKYTKYIMPIADTFAYCLMPNHFHFLLRIKPVAQTHKVSLEPASANLVGFDSGTSNVDISKKISQTFGNFLNSYAKSFNQMYGRRGSLFLDNVQRKVIDNDAYFSECIRYIHLNPVKHGFVKNPADWYWSSYHAHIQPKTTRLCKDEVLEWFGSHENFLSFHQQTPSAKFLKDWDVPY